MSESSRPASQFQRRPPGTGPDIGFEITGGFLTESGEQRRQVCQAAIGEALKKLGRPDITVDRDIEYWRDLFAGYEDSRVRVVLSVPESVNASGQVIHVINVPPYQDWSSQVITTVVGFVVAWAQELA